MFTLTQGAPADYQVVIAWTVATYFVMAPLLLGIAMILGYIRNVTRPEAKDEDRMPESLPQMFSTLGGRTGVSTPECAPVGTAV